MSKSMQSGKTSGPEFFQVETDLNTIMEYTHMLEQFYPDKVVQICRQHHQAAFYVSENCKDFWGIPASRMRYLTMEEYLALIHPEDIDNFPEVHRMIGDFTKEDTDPTQTRYTVIYRMKGPDGDYHTIEDEKVVLKTKSGSYAHFCTYTKVAEKLTVGLEIYRLVNNKKTKVKSHLFRANALQLSARELEIIKLIDKGYSNSEISEHLSISIFTVKNHKQRLFKKTNVKNAIELVNLARNQSII